ncbi:MAG: U32 family peptidase, partial [Christensenellaceae bacterium]
MREILAPAGDKETAMIAVNHGADAVYVGYSSFSARASAVNCSEEELAEVIQYAHIFGAKVYVAMNTMVKDAELDAYVSAFLTLYSLGADAIILQDLFLGKYLHSQYPEVCLHLSTQAGVNNLDGARLAKECGFTRVILARETPISEIKQIASFMETEVFVQGALCSSYSGQCYFSGFVGGNSGNRGRCKQPCRKKYTYLDWTREKEGYVLSPADLCVGERIHELVEAGVSSFKIEGRMRRSEYVASAVRYYRDLLDGRDAREDFHALQRSYNRGDYTKGLAFGQDGRFLSDQTQGHIGERIGSVVRVGQTVLCQSRERGREGDGYKILREGREVAGGVFVANAKGGLEIKVNGKVRPGDEVRITTDTSLSVLNELTRRFPLPMRILFREGERPVAVWKDVRVEGDCPILTAINRPIGEEEICSCFQKTDLYPFAPELTVTVEGKGFLPKADLNAFRRKVFFAIAS